MSIDRGMDKWTKEWKMWYIYTIEYYSAIKRNKIGSFVEMWMDLEPVILSEARKTNIVYYRIYVQFRKMVQRNLFAGQIQRHRHTEGTCGPTGGRGGWDELGD